MKVIHFGLSANAVQPSDVDSGIKIDEAPFKFKIEVIYQAENFAEFHDAILKLATARTPGERESIVKRFLR